MLIDVALITTKGTIVFCFIPHDTLEQFRQMAEVGTDDKKVYAIIELGERRYEVMPNNILVSYGGSFNA